MLVVPTLAILFRPAATPCSAAQMVLKMRPAPGASIAATTARSNTFGSADARREARTDLALKYHTGRPAQGASTSAMHGESLGNRAIATEVGMRSRVGYFGAEPDRMRQGLQQRMAPGASPSAAASFKVPSRVDTRRNARQAPYAPQSTRSIPGVPTAAAAAPLHEQPTSAAALRRNARLAANAARQQMRSPPSAHLGATPSLQEQLTSAAARRDARLAAYSRRPTRPTPGMTPGMTAVTGVTPGVTTTAPGMPASVAAARLKEQLTGAAARRDARLAAHLAARQPMRPTSGVPLGAPGMPAPPPPSTSNRPAPPLVSTRGLPRTRRVSRCARQQVHPHPLRTPWWNPHAHTAAMRSLDSRRGA